jgi:hypothetical protein
LFADDTKLLAIIKSVLDQIHLKDDLLILKKWTNDPKQHYFYSILLKETVRSFFLIDFILAAFFLNKFKKINFR